MRSRRARVPCRPPPSSLASGSSREKKPHRVYSASDSSNLFPAKTSRSRLP